MTNALKATLREIAEFRPSDLCNVNPCEQCQEIEARRDMATSLLERFGSVETGWLIDDGSLCMGTCRNRPAMVAYTDPRAVRFARKEDAEAMIPILVYLLGLQLDGKKWFTAVEHSWG